MASTPEFNTKPRFLHGRPATLPPMKPTKSKYTSAPWPLHPESNTKPRFLQEKPATLPLMKINQVQTRTPSPCCEVLTQANSNEIQDSCLVRLEHCSIGSNKTLPRQANLGRTGSKHKTFTSSGKNLGRTCQIPKTTLASSGSSYP
jgi:hypothetical protein